eukprot:230374-Prorocentrum_minimum.AAC.1
MAYAPGGASGPGAGAAVADGLVARPDRVPVQLWLTGWYDESLPLREVNTGRLFDRIEWAAGRGAKGAKVTAMLHTRAPPERKPPRVVVVFGPTGVGATDMVARLLAEYPEK